jgi:hypothetical protein
MRLLSRLPVWRLLRRLQFFRSGPNISGRYVTSAPSFQNALDIFKGEWWSQLPQPYSHLRAGSIRVFEDPRVHWALSEFRTVNGQTVLELGPLEAAHTYMLERAGFSSILSIEANPHAYLKCLVVKEILELTRTHFLCGDFMEYLRNSPPCADVVFASGVLYHMSNPAELIALASKIADRLFLWTHYYDAAIISRNRELARRLSQGHQSEYAGFQHHLFRYDYGGSFRLARFCGGTRPYAHWMLREEIIACLKHFGFGEIRTSFEEPDHPNGPAFALLALPGQFKNQSHTGPFPHDTTPPAS